jgi:hypothetical protein
MDIEFVAKEELMCYSKGDIGLSIFAISEKKDRLSVGSELTQMS